jgi:hypothetical protein
MDKAVGRLAKKNFPRATEKARGSTNAHSGKTPDLSGTTLWGRWKRHFCAEK